MQGVVMPFLDPQSGWANGDYANIVGLCGG
jgi:hypothetical protein